MRPHFRTWDWALPAWVTGWIQFRSAGHWSVFSASFLVGAGWFSPLPSLQPLLSLVGFLQFGWNTSAWTGGWGYPWCPLHRFQAGLDGLPELTRLMANPAKPRFLGSREELTRDRCSRAKVKWWVCGREAAHGDGSCCSSCSGPPCSCMVHLLMEIPKPSCQSPRTLVWAPLLTMALWPSPTAPIELKPAAPTGPDSDVVIVIMNGWLFPQS